MTNLSKLHLPRWKQYNWHLVFKQWHIAFKAKLVLIALLVGLVVYACEGWLVELNRRLSAEQAHSSLTADVFRLANLGAMTATDYREGTTDIQVRKPK